MFSFKNLVNAQDEYIALLIKEIESMVSIAYTHGWRSDNHEAGVMLREKIAALKQEIAKAEQEGPPNWSNKANYSGDSYIGGYHWFHTLMGKVRDIGIYMQQHEVNSILRSFWSQQIRDIYADMSEWFAYINERESGKQMYREQEGLRWVNLAENPPCVVEDWEDWHGYHVRYASDRVKLDLHLFELRDGALCKIGGTGRLELSEVEWMDESTPPVKEARQPRNLPIEELIKLSDEELNVEINKVRSRLGMGKSEESGQPADDKPFDENLTYELIARFVANSGKKDSIKKIRKEAFVDGALWAKKYLESRHQPAGESAVWVKGNYERLYNQIKGGKRTVCYIDHPRFFQQRDICTIKPNNPDMEFSSRGHGYGGINDPGYCGSEIERFIQLCRGLNAEWLDESGLASSREREVAIAFAEWISQEPHLFGSANYGWYYDIPIDGAGVEHKLIGNTGDLYQYYLQSNNNT